ncbi:hypothetical protein EUX98_g1373 [Antrodiella citrinella]|uniref:Magnesium transporter n=1 Tax=Antrodiella citrinella TaxID=2447956 RepID=A0A4S4N3V2_9APHY|nr:hypothetical protein EUX98_g1373 [Antrodiella citrinella]
MHAHASLSPTALLLYLTRLLTCGSLGIVSCVKYKSNQKSSTAQPRWRHVKDRDVSMIEVINDSGVPVEPHESYPSDSPPKRVDIQDSARPTMTSMTPGDKFRASARRDMAIRRTSSMLVNYDIGAEPGIDPHHASAYSKHGHIRQQSLVEVTDYSSVGCSSRRMSNTEFVDFIGNARENARERWVKVRWINVGGISWDVVSALAVKYDIHPLALEDVLYQHGHAQSKADYYSNHLFLRVLCHTLSDENPEAFPDIDDPTQLAPTEPTAFDIMTDEDRDDKTQKAQAAVFVSDDDRTVYGSVSASKFSTQRTGTTRTSIRRRFNSAPRLSDVAFNLAKHPQLDKKTRKIARNIKMINELKKRACVNVKIQPMCIFLFRDGTVISTHPDPRLQFTAPIVDRLRQRDTTLRATADPSLLVHSLMDLIVDQALEVVEEYHSKILKLEQNVLIKPYITTVQRLHILQGDLILHKRTLGPIKTLVYGLRRYDVDRVAALFETVDPDVKVQGYMSHQAKVYLADVHDHMEQILTSLDIFARVIENLIDYTFNTTSYDMSEIMLVTLLFERRLTTATIIFLPLTLLTGYFGMNFTEMLTTKHGHTDVVFWVIALPVLAIVITIFLWNDFTRMWHHMKKKLMKRAVNKKLRKAYASTS